jgi:hypothetical protein
MKSRCRVGSRERDKIRTSEIVDLFKRNVKVINSANDRKRIGEDTVVAKQLLDHTTNHLSSMLLLCHDVKIVALYKLINNSITARAVSNVSFRAYLPLVDTFGSSRRQCRNGDTYRT